MPYTVLAGSSSYPQFLPETAECRIGCGKYGIDFHVNVGFSGESAFQVGERIGSFSGVPFTTIRLCLCVALDASYEVQDGTWILSSWC